MKCFDGDSGTVGCCFVGRRPVVGLAMIPDYPQDTRPGGPYGGRRCPNGLGILSGYGETNVSAVPAPAVPQAWVPQAHADEGRAERPGPAPGQRTAAPDGVRVIAGAMVLAKPNRLRNSAEFDRVFAEGRTAHGKLLSVRTADAGRFKAGFVVGKTVSLKAVVRNRIRRRLREIVRGMERDDAFKPVELVISAKRTAASADSAGLRAELGTLLGKTGALR